MLANSGDNQNKAVIKIGLSLLINFMAVDKEEKKKVLDLFEKWAGEKWTNIDLLPESGSYRRYYRIKGSRHHAMAAYYDSPNENKAFIELTKHFKAQGLNVPEIFLVDNNYTAYLTEDLGDTVLFDYINQHRAKSGFDDHLINIYKKVIDNLIKFQITAGRNVDYSVCYPSGEFDTQAYLWDLNYFKYSFLKLAQIPYNEYHLEEDFRKLIQLLLSVESSYFVYRDFQTRNIMLRNGKMFFIDYQGGRRGPVHYDMVSLLFQARVAMPVEIREQLIDYYIEQAKKEDPKSVEDFRQHFYKFVLVRILQTLGAYGFRGLYEKKQHFLQSIPLAINNIKWLLENDKITTDLNELEKCLKLIINSNDIAEKVSPPLNVSINSFSYKRGIPYDRSGNGGGFIFDCRALPNPGRLEQFKNLTGNDKEVIKFLSAAPETDSFIQNAWELIKNSVGNYQERKFTNLQINFGCTGGQHRSVYCANRIAQKLYQIEGINISLKHLEQE
jgi:aminoglycoside/choline kinase family phosphotransferase